MSYTDEQEKALYRQAIDQWGALAQIHMACEEAGELIVALMKLNRAENGTDTTKVAGEIADVEIMMGQLKVLLALEPHAEIKARKLQRLEERLKRLPSWVKERKEPLPQPQEPKVRR